MKKILFFVSFFVFVCMSGFAIETAEQNINYVESEFSIENTNNEVVIVVSISEMDAECCVTIEIKGEYADGTKWVKSWTSCSSVSCAEAMSMLMNFVGK
jgi:hypothetical protein